MVRTVVAIAILFLATFFLPLWAQGILYVLAVLFIRYKVAILIPAIFSDAWYAPSHSLTFHNNKTFLLALGVVIIYFLIIRNTRISQKYGLQEK